MSNETKFDKFIMKYEKFLRYTIGLAIFYWFVDSTYFNPIDSESNIINRELSIAAWIVYSGWLVTVGMRMGEDSKYEQFMNQPEKFGLQYIPKNHPDSVKK